MDEKKEGKKKKLCKAKKRNTMKSKNFSTHYQLLHNDLKQRAMTFCPQKLIA